MSEIHIVYASRDGHTRTISDYLVTRLQSLGVFASATDLGAGQPDAQSVQNADVVVVLAAIRYGHPLKPAETFLQNQRGLLASKQHAMLLVNLTARKEHKRSVEGSPYLRKWIKRHGLEPGVAAAIAGKLDYPRYSAFDRFMIRLIMTMTSGPTDPQTCVEFTDWQQVDGLASDIARLAG